MSRQPIAVLTADVHYDLKTLEVADKAMNIIIDKANELQVPVIVAGDFTTNKAHMRSEVVRRSIETFKRCRITPIIITGNHDKDNERSAYYAHALEYLRPYTTIIDSVAVNHIPHWTLIPYQHDLANLRIYLKDFATRNIIMHQGIAGTDAGEYIQDRTALIKEDLAGRRVISGHYHKRQTFELPKGGQFDYIGNPYTLTFGEANDPDKGYQILYDDGSLEFVPTNLRRHAIFDFEASQIEEDVEGPLSDETENLILWIKVHGTKAELSKIDKKLVSQCFMIKQDFKLDLIPVEVETNIEDNRVDKLSQAELLDETIDSMSNTDNPTKERLKLLWKDL